MLTVALTSIPPRFAGLGPTLESLLAQSGVGRVVLTLPRVYDRFPGPVTPPPLPSGVDLHWSDTDLGPATKVLPLAATLPAHAPFLFCDDDWAYGPGWAAGFAAAHAGDPATALAAQPFDATRIGRSHGTIVQGYAGVLVTPAMLAPLTPPPSRFRPVDDIWLSALIAANGVPVRPLPDLRALARPTGNEAAPLQENGSRATLNRDCAAYCAKRFGIWR
ncbi:hypothetical protein [Salibaculum griseiflavum]|uniref:Glycosyl transferase family 2 n=1 Tax=Salibaculum griseiflavum TaxID=1914409 RepID=A0A2V1P7G8_9RHOB|nr:hypothetical protein [Salibaculum griseiflavum]PWG17738.1 hypothetical protein DFK10_05845 [Salibaculum griseiflavum]